MAKIKIQAVTIKGFKEKNQDCLYINGWYMEDSGACNQYYKKEYAADAESITAVAVADGVSSSDNGEIASFLVMQSLDNWLEGIDIETDDLVSEIREGFGRCNRDLVDYAEQESKRMATTLTALIVLNDRYYVANIGDSPAFLIHNGELTQLHDEQTYGALIRRRDGISDKKKDNMLISYLGNREADAGKEVYITKERKLQDGDRILICSDGLTKAMDTRMILKYLLDRKKGFNKMINSIGKRQKDNCTAILFEVKKE